MVNSRKISGAPAPPLARRSGMLTLPVCFGLAYLASAVGLAVALVPFGPLAVGIALAVQLSLGFALGLGVSRACAKVRLMARKLRAREPSELFEVDRGELSHLGDLGKAVSEFIESMIEAVKKLEESNVETVKTIALAMEARDPYTQGHCLRVRYLARQIVERLGGSHELKRTVEIAALLHDVGKIGVPDCVLLKAGELTEEEFARIIQHVYNGAEILSPISALKDVKTAILHHHERYDGTGYPFGLRGEEIPLPSRIIAVADAVDAMRSTRPYRAALKPQEIVAELRRARGTQLDPRVVDVAIAILEERARRRAVASAASSASVERTQRMELEFAEGPPAEHTDVLQERA